MTSTDDVQQDVYEAVDAIAQGHRPRLMPILHRIGNSSDVMPVANAVFTVAEALRRTSDPRFGELVETQIEEHGPRGSVARPAYIAFCRATFLDGDGAEASANLDLLTKLDDGTLGESLLAATFIAGHVVSELGGRLVDDDGQPVTVRTPAPRPRTSRTHARTHRSPIRQTWSVIVTVVGVVFLILIVWGYFRARDDEFKLRCAAFQGSGTNSLSLPDKFACVTWYKVEN